MVLPAQLDTGDGSQDFVAAAGTQQVWMKGPGGKYVTADQAMVQGAFGAAGNRVVIEEFLVGEEASIFALSDGNAILPLVAAQDHKRVGEHDTGPNTGGMGAYSPAPVVTPTLHARVLREAGYLAVRREALGDRLVAQAKQTALALARSGYRPPAPPARRRSRPSTPWARASITVT